MAEAKKGGPQKKKCSSKSTCYTTTNDGLKRKNKFCPKCGPGVFMAAHKNRVQCGKCGYMEKQ